MTTGITIAMTRRTFVGKVMSLLFNMLSRLVITFLQRSKCLLISWLQSPSAMILEPKKIQIKYKHKLEIPLSKVMYKTHTNVKISSLYPENKPNILDY